LSGFGPQLQRATEGGVAFGDFARFSDFYAELWPKEGYLEGVFPCIGPIAYTGHTALQRDIDNLKTAMAAAGATSGFLPVAAPASAFAMSPNSYYKTDEEYMFAGAEALRVEYKSITDAGLFVQIDDAHLPFMYDRMVPPGTPADFRKWARVRIDALNHALRGVPEDRVRYHICWGSWNGPHTCDVPLKEIVDLVLSVRAGAYAIEAANARHEDAHPRRREPPDQRRRASGARRGAPRALCGRRRPRQRHGRHRLWFCPGAVRAARPSFDPVG
jgi:5-methyltetrahydropteroyltriglutamate--homocysteine methyltransferase